MLKIVQQAHSHRHKTAVVSNSRSHTFQDLLTASAHFAHLLLEEKEDLSETRVAFMVSPGFDYVRVQWGIWQAGGIIVPLCLTYVAAGLAATNPKLVPYGAMTATFYTGLGCLLCPSILYVLVKFFSLDNGFESYL